ncbi:MAG TPA: carboxypeptidase regulatory-like domain-containing protein [Pyrinomonadaceae bacterium]|nr:carboxypeptidase regulatory-like domain-containing protein [Pyrinomonadaceae bacterium]
MHIRISSHLRLFSAALLALAFLSQALIFVSAQTETTGAFRGRVVDESGAGLPDATVRATNKLTGVPTATRTTPDGYFTIGLLQPGDYTLTVLKGDMYDVRTRDQRLTAVDATTVLPEPFVLKRRTAGAVATTSPTPTTTGTPDATAQATPQATASPAASSDEGADVAIDINKRNPRRGGIFTREEVSTLPLGATTLTRSFDELALLLPGVATPPQTLGSIAGPGVGPGVGSAGQFAVNGMRSRSNNFTVDGSDNNDEDIGVRRQGFLALVPQPIESIQEYQVTTLLAPAQYGRNLGAQVNAVSKSGGNDLHGTIYGFLNSSQLNARNPFDTINGNTVSPLFAGSQPVVLNCPAPCTSAAAISASQIRVQNFSGDKDSFTLAQGGLVLGGKLVPDRLFYFISAEGQSLNASKEASFAVPTVQQRGAFGSGASGIFLDPFFGTGAFAYPTTVDADAIFSLFPFPNNPNGIYGANTFTRVLPASGQGKILSGKVDGNWKWNGRQQSFTARYNFTDDYRDIPVTGEALFSTLRPRVRTQNFSTFLNSQLSGLNSSRPVFNQLRASYGRTRLNFQEYLDTGFQLRSDQFPSQPFLLNAPLRINNTLPNFVGFNPVTGAIISTPNTGPVRFFATGTTEQLLGPVGQVKIAGFSPVGVDVFNFPQRRVNNTYQVADTMTVRLGNHNLAFGTDIRRTELNSDLPRLARPLITFNGAPRLLVDFTPAGDPVNFRFSGFINPLDLAASSAASGFFQTLSSGTSAINLRYYQYNFFAQDEWRVTENFVLSYGLRYEYNTPPRETSRRIESTFNSSQLSLVPGLSKFIDGRKGIFDADKNNFAPRVGFAYSPRIFGPDHTTVLRAGYGLFYDQILGAVVSQSRNVFPTAATLNFAGGLGALLGGEFDLFNPQLIARTGTLNQIDPALPIGDIIDFLKFFGGVNAFGVTLPERTLKTPMAHQYGVTLEQQLSRSLVFSAAYVGTQGRNLLRLTTPNLGPNVILLPIVSSTALDPFGGTFTPGFSGVVLSPGTLITNAGDVTGGRPVKAAGPVEIYKSNARSRYDSLQLQLRGRFGFLGSASQFQAQYTFSKSRDDASDVFDLAGSPALPQDSLTQAGEYAPSNFDVRHRFSYNYISDLSSWGRGNAFLHFLFNGTQVAGTGIFQTGQPFTINSIYDVNLDGNLTDRPNTTTGIQATGNRARPYVLTTNNPTSLLAPVGQNGAIPRNAFRGSNLWLTNSSIIKNFRISEDKSLTFRMDIFNLFNRANYGIPVRYLETPWFGRATDTVTPGRRIQFAIKYTF